MKRTDQTKAVLIVTVAIVISGVSGVGPAIMSGHEAVIFPFLEWVFLVVYGLALLVLSFIKYRSNNKTTGRLMLLTSFLPEAIVPDFLAPAITF